LKFINKRRKFQPLRLFSHFIKIIIGIVALTYGITTISLANPSVVSNPSIVLKGIWEQRVYSPPFLALHYTDMARALVYKGRVFVGSSTGKLCSFDLETGKRYWCVTPTNKKAIYSRPLAHKNALFIGGYDGCVHKLDINTGKELAAKPFCTDGSINADLSGQGDRLFFTTNTGKAYSLDTNTLAFRWQQHINRPEQFRILAQAGVLVNNGICFIGFYNGKVKAVDCADGRIKWTTNLAADTGRFHDILFTPVLVNNLLVVSGYTDGLAALDPASGKVKWNIRVAAPSSIGRLGNNILITTADKDIMLVSREGKIIRRSGLPVEFTGTPISTGDGTIILPMDRGMAIIGPKLDIQTVYVVHGGLSARPAVFANKLLFMDNRGVFNCLEVLQP